MKRIKMKLSAGSRIVGINELPGGGFEVIWEETEDVTAHKITSEDTFILIEAESLCRDDDFMKHKPCTRNEERTKKLITEAIDSNVKNFYRPIMDPSFIDNEIAYVAGKPPVVGKSYTWWKKTARKFYPSRKSRLGTCLEYGAFLGVLIKRLVAEGKSVEWAWNAVCNCSKELGHYYDSEDTQRYYESTGSRGICGFYDLANTCKILSEGRKISDACLAGGYFGISSESSPLASLYHHYRKVDRAHSVGWIVLS